MWNNAFALVVHSVSVFISWKCLHNVTGNRWACPVCHQRIYEWQQNHNDREHIKPLPGFNVLFELMSRCQEERQRHNTVANNVIAFVTHLTEMESAESDFVSSPFVLNQVQLYVNPFLTLFLCFPPLACISIRCYRYFMKFFTCYLKIHIRYQSNIWTHLLIPGFLFF